MDEASKNIPPHLKVINSGESAVVANLANLQKGIEQVISDYRKHKNNREIPESLILALASLGDESMRGYEHVVEKQYDSLLKKINAIQKRATETARNSSNRRRANVLAINKVLIAKIDGRTWTVNRVATKIFDQWDAIPAHGRQQEELTAIVRRGDGDRRPCVNTISSWVRSQIK